MTIRLLANSHCRDDAHLAWLTAVEMRGSGWFEPKLEEECALLGWLQQVRARDEDKIITQGSGWSIWVCDAEGGFTLKGRMFESGLADGNASDYTRGS